MEKKISALLSLILLFSCILPACSDDTTKEEASSTESTTAVITTAAPSGSASPDASVPSSEDSAGATVGATVAVSTTKGSTTITTKPNKPASGGSSVGTSAPAVTTKPKPGTPSPTLVDTIESDPFSFYQKAAKEIHDKGTAGYTKKTWQTITKDYKLSVENPTLSTTLSTLINSFLTAEADAAASTYAKGSAGAKSNMPISNCTVYYVTASRVVKSGSNYVVTISLRDQIDPEKSNVQGLNIMSCDLIYREDISAKVMSDTGAKALLKGINKGNISYTGYTITATMTKAGRFVDIKHHTNASVTANLALLTGTNADFSYTLSIDSHYYGFKY